MNKRQPARREAENFPSPPIPKLEELSMPSVVPRRGSVHHASFRPNSNRLGAIPSDWQLPANDIDSCIVFSWARCVFSLISLALLVTDIPRTGLGVENVYQLFPNKAGPSVTEHFGPWAYPVAHIWRNASSNSTAFEAKKGSSAIGATNLWSYNYDTTSIGIRGIEQLLNVSMQYRDSPGDYQTKLSLRTTWTLLDNLVSAVQGQLVDRAHDASHSQHRGYFVYTTQHYWIDRLHHYLYRHTKANTRWRMHSIHTYTKDSEQPDESLSICSSATRRRRPLFCDHPVQWLCTHPLNTSLPKVPIWDQVDLRLSAMQKKYPGLRLDLTIFTTFNPSTSAASVVSAYFQTEVLEIVMLVRGRACSTPNSPDLNDGLAPTCTTVFVDDYRYERGVLESNIAEWYPFTATLRSIAQFYVWIRLLLLFAVAYSAAKDRHPLFRDRLSSTLQTMSKIPFQVVVYGSLFPVVCYVAAHYIDCSFVDLFLETYWTTVNGTTHFDLMTFVRHASVQMRNVWILALFMKGAVFFQTRVLLWRPHNGIQGIRGLAISLSSALSVFGPFRSLAFRNTSIISVFALSGFRSNREGSAMEQVHARPSSLFNISMEGLEKDMKMTLLAACTVFAIALVGNMLLALLRSGYRGEVLFGSSIVVPYSAGILWPTTALSVRFWVSTATAKVGNVSQYSTTRVVPTPLKSRAPLAKHTERSFRNSTSRKGKSLLASVRKSAVAAVFATLGIDREAETMHAKERCSLHDRTLRFEKRTMDVNSIVRLMNIAMMTDPWTFACLRVFGVEVYFYKSAIPPRQRNESSRAATTANSIPHQIFLLPCSPDKMLEWTGYGSDEYSLIGHMNSRDLPWSVLLQCG